MQRDRILTGFMREVRKTHKATIIEPSHAANAKNTPIIRLHRYCPHTEARGSPERVEISLHRVAYLGHLSRS